MFRSESFPNKLKLISFADVIGRKPTQPHIANPTENENVQSPTTSKSPTPSPAASYNHSTPHIASLSPTPPNLVSPTGHITPSDSITPSDPPPYNPTAPRSHSTSSSAMQGLPAATPSMLASSPSVANDSYPTTAGDDKYATKNVTLTYKRHKIYTHQKCHRLFATSLFYRLFETCHLQTCYNLLKQLAASLWITSFDNQLATSLLTTCKRLVVMRTHPDKHISTCCQVCCTKCFSAYLINIW